MPTLILVVWFITKFSKADEKQIENVYNFEIEIVLQIYLIRKRPCGEQANIAKALNVGQFAVVQSSSVRPY